MFDFFETIRSFYMNEKFCDVNFVSYSFSGDEPIFNETIKCHSLVLSCAVPNIRTILKTNSSDDPETVVVVVQDEAEQVSVKQTIDDIYNCFAGQGKPDPQSW